MPITTSEVENRIRNGETLTVEFKGESHRRFSDEEIVEAVVCLANASGGVILLGVEDDGTVTGVQRSQKDLSNPAGLEALIFNRTMPSVSAYASMHRIAEKYVVAIEVAQQSQICATSTGKTVRRTLTATGPECVPFYPHEHGGRLTDLGLLDYSARMLERTTWEDLDPLEIERLRQTIRQRMGTTDVLLSLDDHELMQGLRLVETRNDRLVPNVAGLLLVGREPVLRDVMPTHEVAFQELDEQGNVITNDWLYSPLLKTLESLEERFAVRNREQEITLGLFRIPIPDYAPESFREAVANAVCHRDFTRLGTVFVQFYPDYLFMSNPGGFPEGITLDNLLSHEPKPRNNRLAEVFRRLGIVETTGRGIDKIYAGQLRYGRPLPDYSQSNIGGVRLSLRGGEASLAFTALVAEQNQSGPLLNLAQLLALNHLQHERRIDGDTLARLVQRDVSFARSQLEQLVERGLIEARGERRGRTYHLSAALYRELGTPVGYIRTVGFDTIQQETMIAQYLKTYGRITRRDVMELCQLTDRQASYLLERLVKANRLQLHGTRRSAYYTIG